MRCRTGMLKYDVAAASLASGVRMAGPGRAQQNFKEQCDINVIVKNFERTGLLPQRTAPPLPADFHEIFDFQSAQNILVQAKQAFLEVPARIRRRFHDDPGEYVAFLSDPANADEAVKLGLAEVRKKEPEKVQKVEIVNAPQPKGAEGSSPTKP